MFLSIDPAAKTEAVSVAIDYDNFVVLPKTVAFKGSNGQYFRYYIKDDDYSGVGFFGDDIGDQLIVLETQYSNDGHSIRLKLVNSGDAKLPFLATWGAHMVLGGVGWGPLIEPFRSTVDDTIYIISQWFAVIMVDSKTIALRNLDNNKICRVLKGDVFPGSLSADADGLVADTHLQVVEPIISRTVIVPEFDLDKARIYDLQLIYSASYQFDNPSDQIQSGTTNGTISATKSKTFSNSVNVSGTVTTTFKTGIPLIAEGSIEVSATAGYTHQWDTTEEETQSVGNEFTVVVVPRKRTIARGVATKAKCDVPFTYIQKDYPTSGGPPIVTKLSDGVFTGANAYSFQTEVRYEDLPAHLSGHKPQMPDGEVTVSIVPPPSGQ